MLHHDDTEPAPPPCKRCGREGNNYDEWTGDVYCIGCAMRYRDNAKLQVLGAATECGRLKKYRGVETPVVKLCELKVMLRRKAAAI
jgi:hypothetical protein